MFEKAARLKLRFNFKGLSTVEDLWDISLEGLDMMFKNLNACCTIQKEESLLETKSQEDKILDLKIEIIKHVVKVRLDEQRARENEVSKAAKKQKLLGIIEEKQDTDLRELSVEDLTKLVDEL